jgi:hypothetical protein
MTAMSASSVMLAVPACAGTPRRENWVACRLPFRIEVQWS